MPPGEGKQLVDGAGRVESVGIEQGLDVVSGLGDWQGRKLKRAGVTVERSLVLGEQGRHHPWLAAREHVGGSLSVVLDDRTHQAVERVIGNQEILELIQTDNRELAVGVVQCSGHIEQLKQGGTGLVCCWAWGLRSYAYADSGNRGAEPQARRPTPNAASRIVRRWTPRL